MGVAGHGQAIDVLDETGARVRLRESSILPEEAKEAQQKLKEVMGQKDCMLCIGRCGWSLGMGSICRFNAIFFGFSMVVMMSFAWLEKTISSKVCDQTASKC